MMILSDLAAGQAIYLHFGTKPREVGYFCSSARFVPVLGLFLVEDTNMTP